MELQARHRNPELIAALTLRALPGTHRINIDDIPTEHQPATATRALKELLHDGIIRTKRNRNGQRIEAHALTTLGLAWWQGRTTLPVPRLINDTWTWWTPTDADDLQPLAAGGLGFTPWLDEPTELLEADDPTQDDDATIDELLAHYRPPTDTHPP